MGRSNLDEFVRARIDPKLLPVVTLIRSLIKECASDAQEVMSYGIPVYKANRFIAVISPTKGECYFQVAAVDNNGNEMARSEVTTTDGVDCPPP